MLGENQSFQLDRWTLFASTARFSLSDDLFFRGLNAFRGVDSGGGRACGRWGACVRTCLRCCVGHNRRSGQSHWSAQRRWLRYALRGDDWRRWSRSS
jgi:hypothetical protein